MHVAGRADGVDVHLTQHSLASTPEIYLGHCQQGEATAGMLLPLDQAADAATLLARLGHPGLATLITTAESQPCHTRMSG